MENDGLSQLHEKISDAVHDLNNIMAIIEGYTAMLSRQCEDAQAQAKLHAIQMAVLRGVEKVEDLANLAEQAETLDKNMSFGEMPQQGFQNKTVLVVDDEESLLPVLEDQLQSLGLRVLKAANADSALYLQAHYPGAIDFLLTDMIMPGMDGVQLGEIMARQRPEMNVIYMTGYSADIRRNLLADASSKAVVVDKPLRPENLSAAMRKALENIAGI